MTAQHEIPPPRIASVNALLATFRSVILPDVFERLGAALNERDNQIADTLREAALIHGAMPQLTAEVICQLGIGDQPDPDTRVLIHAQYHATMAELIRLQEGDH